MLLSAVSVLVVAQSSSEIPEGLMNNPVHFYSEYLLQVGRNSDSLRAGRSSGRIPVIDIFRTLADRPLGPPSLLYNRYREWPLWNPTVHRQRTTEPYPSNFNLLHAFTPYASKINFKAYCSPASDCGGPGSHPGQSRWDFSWANW